ncbi:lysine--tRNA ligase [Candidatus Peregrinibacteria bacterium]|nr:lysine--tRNA ligase [Candidatus Peregrinibacteria bacterium]
MFWVDRIADEILAAYPGKNEFIIRDEKTLSGQVHVGSLRGVLIHGVMAEALNQRGVKARFIYEFNDADPMDGMPAYLDKEVYNQHMGKPLKDVPAPGDPASEIREYNGMKATSLAEYFGLEFLKVIHRLGFENTEITWARKLYSEGFYDEAIRKVLAHPDDIRGIYRSVSGSEKPEDWMPLQMVCEKCGKIGSTKVVDFDGNVATYKCMPDMVDWAKGCGHEGKAEPWRGVGKLPWKVEWPVKWASYQVDIEGSGKDHCAAGGSHDVGERICAEVLETVPPFNIPYEFFLLGGAKMSSSKGNAASAKAVSDLLPPELFRFLMIMKEPNQPIEFSPDGDTIPRLFDKYDEAGRHFFLNEEENTYPDLDRLFYFSQLDPNSIPERYFPRFSKLVFLSQIPSIDVEEAVAREKKEETGKDFNEHDKKELETRLKYVKTWLETHAPDSFIYKVIEDEIPESAYDLSIEQKTFLKNIAEMLKSVPDSLRAEGQKRKGHASACLEGEYIHSETHRLVKESGLAPREAFPAIYHSLLGKEFGPKVGWFIEALDRDFIVKRFEEVSNLEERIKEVIEPFVSDLLIVNGDVIEKFPGLKSAFIELRGIKIGKNNEKLTKMIDELVENTDWQAIKENSEQLAEYKRIFKEFKVDPTKRKPSPVAIIDRLAKGKPFPRINNMVDLYNYIVAKSQCSIGAFDMDVITAPITLRFAEKGEVFQGIMDKEKPLDAGELCYFDASGLCIARNLCYLDSDKTKMTEEITNVYLNADATESISSKKFQEILDELVFLAVEICGGEIGERAIKS